MEAEAETVSVSRHYFFCIRVYLLSLMMAKCRELSNCAWRTFSRTLPVSSHFALQLARQALTHIRIMHRVLLQSFIFQNRSLDSLDALLGTQDDAGISCFLVSWAIFLEQPTITQQHFMTDSSRNTWKPSQHCSLDMFDCHLLRPSLRFLKCAFQIAKYI